MKNAFYSLIIATVIFLTGFGAYLSYSDGHGVPVALADTQPLVLPGPTTPSSVTVNTIDTLVVATSSSRQYLVLVNDSSSTIYLNFGNLAVVGKGITLEAGGGSYEINGDNLFTGAVRAIASSTAGNLTYIQR